MQSPSDDAGAADAADAATFAAFVAFAFSDADDEDDASDSWICDCEDTGFLSAGRERRERRSMSATTLMDWAHSMTYFDVGAIVL